MRHALPLWCCLNTKSKLALLDKLEALGETEFSEPLPVWRDWRPDVIGIASGEVKDNVDYAKEMRQPPKSPRKVK